MPSDGRSGRHRRLTALLTVLPIAISGTLVLVGAPATAAPVQPSASSPTQSAAGLAPTSATAARPKPASTAQRRAEARRKAAARKAAARKAAARKAAARKAAAKKAVARKAAAKKAKARARLLAKRRAWWKARWAKVRPFDPRTWIRWAPGRYTPRYGPAFNNPYGSKAQRRRLLEQVIATVNSTPGYLRPKHPRTKRPMPCPSQPRFFPARIRVAAYSIVDRRFATAVTNAHRRCVSVQILMNSHLTAVTSPSYGRIRRVLGPKRRNWRAQRSFAYRCSNGCLGTSVLHSKIYLFDRAGRTRQTVMTGSANISRNGVKIQWNDLFTVNRNPPLFRAFRQMFDKMVPDRKARGPWVFRGGRLEATFFPQRRATPRTDKTLQALRSVRCRGARGGTGIKGRTVVYVNMHAWGGKRGRLASKSLHRMYRRGCYVRILYSFMPYATFYRLVAGTGPRMKVRRVLFPGPKGIVAAKYSHMKMLAVSGRVGADRSAKVVWTGSNNWSDRGNRADEVTLRIPSASVYDAYVRQWKRIKKRRSTAFWARFEEPTGGGRAPAPAD